MDRRSFLKLGALTASSGAVGACGQTVQKVIPALIPADDGVNPVDGRWYATSCMECNAGCGVIVRTVNGRAKKIEGNPAHPVNHGKACAMGQAAVRRAYHADRLKAPLLRKGGKGSKLEEVTWDEAIKVLGEKIAKSGGKMFYLNDGINDSLAGAAKSMFGDNPAFTIASNHAPGRESHFAAGEAYLDFPSMPFPDIANSDFTLLFGADVFESDRSPVYFARVFGDSRRSRPAARGRFVYLGSRLSATAAACDKWLPVPPGKLGLVALSVAHVVVDEVITRGLAPSIPRNTLSRWMDALKQYSPEHAEKETELSAEIIKRLAKPFIEEAPAVAVAGDDVAGYTNGTSTLKAVSFLNMVSYEIGREKLRIKPRRDPAPDPDLKSRMLGWLGLPQSQQSFTKLKALTEGMAAGAFEVGLIAHTNPVFDTPQALNFKAALAKTPFTAVFALFMDETTADADLVLPDHHWLENWSAQLPEFAPGVPVLNLVQPVIAPFTSARNSLDVLIEAAKKGGVATPYANGEQYLKALIAKFRAEMLEVPQQLSDAGAWDFLLQRGGWWPSDEEADPKSPPTTDRLWELKDNLTAPVAAFAEGANFPFHLHLYQPVSRGRGKGSNLGVLQEMPDPITTLMWQHWVEINPVTAEKLGIKEGDLITVMSAAGSMTGPAFPYPGIRPDVIAIPIGFGHTNYGSLATNRGDNPMKLLGLAVDEKSGALAWRSQKVGVKKAGGSVKMLRDANPKGEYMGEAFNL